MTFFSLDPTIRITVWSGLLGTAVVFLTRYSADQMVLQRFLAARSDRDAVRALWLNIIAVIFALVLLALFGLAIHAYARRAGHDHLPGMKQLVMVLRDLPPGATGVVAAGLLAAAMSSLDSGINACSAILSQEWNINSPHRDGDTVVRTRGITLLLGAAAVALSFPVGTLGSLFEIANRAINGMGSPLLALMLLAAFSRRTTSFGAFWGGLIGVTAGIVISFTVNNLALHYYALVNCVVTVLPCLALSTWDCARGTVNARTQLDWTWYGWRQRRNSAVRANLPPS